MEAAPVAPTPPPMPYRVAGQVVREGAAHVVLAAGDRVITVRAGEKLDDRYVVESIGAEGVTLLYEPLGVREKLPFNSALGLDVPLAKSALAPAEVPAVPAQQAAGGESKPARLRWDGPASVKAGDTFDVALRVTSERPVRASPLSLSFDAKLLEPVNVRPGDFFSSGSFNYRINPAGSIFVGALSPGAAAKDAEFVVVTFRPIRAGATAELRLSSFALHGIAGGTIAHDRPADFRAAIQ
jgi:general secretion pathway protein D